MTQLISRRMAAMVVQAFAFAAASARSFPDRPIKMVVGFPPGGGSGVVAPSVLPINPGDIIATGVPEGVGPFGPGDVVRIPIDGVGGMALSVRELDAIALRRY